MIELQGQFGTGVKERKIYEDWFRRYDQSPVLRLETDRLDWLTDLVDRVDLFRKIERYLD